MMMMFTSIAGKRVLLAKPTAAMRCFSSGLLVPLQSKAAVPAEIENSHISDYAHAQLQEKYAAFNEQCKAEQKEMNNNIIENIANRGGTEGWDVDDYSMRKNFEFDSFEECQAFVMRVAKDAEEKDHHPEWSLSNGGKTVNVKLTSHFANNTVTRLDVQLAEDMNNAFTETRSSFKMFPMFTPSQWASIKIGAGMLVFGMFVFKFMTGSNYEEKTIAPAPLPSIDFKSTAGQVAASQAYADVSAVEEVVDYAYGDYEKRDNFRPLSGC